MKKTSERPKNTVERNGKLKWKEPANRKEKQFKRFGMGKRYKAWNTYPVGQDKKNKKKRKRQEQELKKSKNWKKQNWFIKAYK
ncbi:hypothetical protein HYE16_01580 [Mycoplasmopsis bovis]|nr:hypothetical protein HYE16_01580 [Mycoplasmopsis bovis]